MRGWPTYYVIRHQSIYGNSNIIAVDIFNMIWISLPSANCWKPLLPQLNVIPQSGHIVNFCKYISILYKYSWVLHRCKMVGLHYLAFQNPFFYKRNAIIAQPPWSRCHLVFGKIVNNMLFRGLYTNLCTCTTSICTVLVRVHWLWCWCIPMNMN